MERLQRELFEAAAKGDVSSLQHLLIEDLLLLDRATPNYNSETALHVSALLGHLDFVKEIIRIKPELTNELNSQQSSPLHLASAKGHVNVVRELLSAVGHETTCLARDKDGLTPLHLAAIKGRVEVMELLLRAQPDAARLTLYGGETILHLCVKNWQPEALKLVVSSVNDPEFVKSEDGEGNTLQHLAVEYKKVELPPPPSPTYPPPPPPSHRRHLPPNAAAAPSSRQRRRHHLAFTPQLPRLHLAPSPPRLPSRSTTAALPSRSAAAPRLHPAAATPPPPPTHRHRPHRIDVKGQDFELLPFGSSRRMCPGYALGLKVIQSSLANLLHGFNWRMPDKMKPEQLNMEEIFGLSTPRKYPLVAVAQPRLPLDLYKSL